MSRIIYRAAPCARGLSLSLVCLLAGAEVAAALPPRQRRLRHADDLTHIRRYNVAGACGMDHNPKSPTVVSFGYDVLDRMVLAVERVRDRLHRATAALEAVGVPYAVIGGNAVAAWVSRIDPGAVRNTVDVDLLVNRHDFDRIKLALASVGFIYHNTMGVEMFIDGPDGSARDAVHVLFTGEKVKQHYVAPTPDLSATDRHESFRILAFEPLVRMKLASFRDKDRTHLRDMIEVGLLDRTWLDRLQPELAARLKELLDNPQG